MSRKYRVLGYPADDEEGPRPLALILFFVFVCVALAVLYWIARGA